MYRQEARGMWHSPPLHCDSGVKSSRKGNVYETGKTIKENACKNVFHVVPLFLDSREGFRPITRSCSAKCHLATLHLPPPLGCFKKRKWIKCLPADLIASILSQQFCTICFRINPTKITGLYCLSLKEVLGITGAWGGMRDIINKSKKTKSKAKHAAL